MKRRGPSNRPSPSSKTLERREARCASSSACSRRTRSPPRARRVARPSPSHAHAAPERVRPERGHAAAVRRPSRAAGRRSGSGSHSSLPAKATPGALPSAGPSPRASADVGGQVVGEPLAVEAAQQRRHLGRRSAAAAPPPANGRSSRTGAPAGRVSAKPSSVVVHRVEPLPGDRRQHHERARPVVAALGLGQAGHRQRPDGAVAPGAHAHQVDAGPRVARDAHRGSGRRCARPARIASGSPERESDEVEGAVDRPDLEPRPRARRHDAERAAQREAAHRHAGARAAATPRARDLRGRDGRVAGSVAHGDGEGVVAVRRGPGASDRWPPRRARPPMRPRAAKAAHDARRGRRRCGRPGTPAPC